MACYFGRLGNLFVILDIIIASMVILSFYWMMLAFLGVANLTGNPEFGGILNMARGTLLLSIMFLATSCFINAFSILVTASVTYSCSFDCGLFRWCRKLKSAFVRECEETIIPGFNQKNRIYVYSDVKSNLPGRWKVESPG